MIKRLAPYKTLLLQLAATALAVAAIFGYRCPAQGCPLCRLSGQ